MNTSKKKNKMKIALVDGSPKKSIRTYPLPLLKIGAWKKSLGIECALFSSTLPQPGEFDEIWITTRFTFDIPFAVGMGIEALNRADVVRVGGIAATLIPSHFEESGLNVHKGLIPEAEEFSPDWSLLNEVPKYSITHTSRGCIRKCKFCMVSILEPTFAHRPGWEKDLHPATKRVLFYDNNWIAKDWIDFKSDVEIIRRLVASGQVSSIDFNQSLDCRLMTPKIAEQLKGLPIRPVRFAFDGMQEDGYYQDAIKMMVDVGFRDFMADMLYNYTDTPADFYYRLRESVRLCEETGAQVKSFPMPYAPILKPVPSHMHVGKHWTRKKARGVVSIIRHHSWSGQVSPHSIKEFEYWFGKDAEEFEKLISYPQIDKLCKRKKGKLRTMRARNEL